jgi:23S rRNA (adenine2030-N6)-methyltransferase
MKYRHAFHAGNFADVHKHVTLLALLRGMQRKDKGFLYLDTHAGRGLYDLEGADSHHGAEARRGFGLLRNSTAAAAEISDYLRCVEALRRMAASGNSYPGSPLIAAHTLRSQDRGLCCEVQAAECRALERSLAGLHPMRCECSDGWRSYTAHLPPVERRALVLIDPPYEDSAADLAAGIKTIHGVLSRLTNAVIALWYPIKEQRDLAPWLSAAGESLQAPVLGAQLWVHPRDSRVALNGSGMLIVNPPYQLDARMAEWLPELGTLLGCDEHGGTATTWLVNEQT